MRHYIRINKQINLPLSLEAEAYLEDYGLRDEIIYWRDNYCVFNKNNIFKDLTQLSQEKLCQHDSTDEDYSTGSKKSQNNNGKQDNILKSTIEVLQLEIIDENIELIGQDKLSWKKVYLGEE